MITVLLRNPNKIAEGIADESTRFVHHFRSGVSVQPHQMGLSRVRIL